MVQMIAYNRFLDANVTFISSLNSLSKNNNERKNIKFKVDQQRIFISEVFYMITHIFVRQLSLLSTIIQSLIQPVKLIFVRDLKIKLY